MPRHERRHPPDAVVSCQERTQSDGSIEHAVQLLDIGHAFTTCKLEK